MLTRHSKYKLAYANCFNQSGGERAFYAVHRHFKNIFLKLIDLLDFDASFIGERHPMPCTLKSEYHPIGTSPC